MIFLSEKKLRERIASLLPKILWDVEIKQTTENLAESFIVYIGERLN